MNMDEGLTIKVWLEEYEKHFTDNGTDQFHYDVKKFNLNKQLIQSIEVFLKKNHLQWDVLIHAAWGLLLNRFSSADFILFGTTTLHNSRTNVLKINQTIYPINSIINTEMTSKNFIQKIKSQLSKKNHVKENTPEDFRYLLAFSSSSATSKTKKQSRKSDNVILADMNRFPLILAADKKKLGKISIFYHPSLFSPLSIESIFNHLAVIFQEIVKDTKQKIVDIDILTEEEKKIILSNWSKATYPFKTPNLIDCAYELFMQQAKQLPDNLAVQYHHTTVTYKQLDDASTCLAQVLLEKGVKSGDCVCVLMDRTPTLIMAMLAIFKTGAIYVPINPKYPEERIEFVIHDSQAKYILVNDLEKISTVNQARAIKITEQWESLEFNKKNNPLSLPKINLEKTAYIIYTSGTTGKPKGVMIRQKSLTNLVAWYRSCFSVTQKDRSAQFASQAFDTFLCETIPYLASGASVHIVDDNTKLTPTLFFAWLASQKITICDLPTAYAQMLFTMPWPKNIDLRTVKIGGEIVTHYPTQTLHFDIWNGYGPTETTIETTYNKIYEANSLPHSNNKHVPPPIGKPIANTEAYIVDKYLKPVPAGICGELLIGGVGVSVGYLNHKDLTNTRFIPNIFNNKNEKLYRTGDLARWLSDGNLEFIGRIDHQVKIRGYRIELGEIETAISQHTDVNEVVVMAKENLNGEKSLIAYVIPDLNKERYLYQERCLLSISNNKYIEAITEDISKEGVALSGIVEPIQMGHLVQLHLKLPGFTEGKLLSGHIIWQQDKRCGIEFDLNEEEKIIVEKSIEYYLSTHNVMELVLSASAKRSLRKALRKKIPEYMVPSVFVTLLQFPLTFSGKIDIKALPEPLDFEKIQQKEYVAPKTETEKKLVSMWEDLLNQKNISISDSFFDLGGNSLKVAELSVKILHQFKKTIPTKILFDLPYVSILAEYIDSKGKKYSTQSVIQEEIQRDCRLHENILPTKKLSPTIKKPQHILLTGAGGFLGVYMLRELLIHTKAKIYCLIRKGEFETAAKRLVSTIKHFNLSHEISLSNRRIIAIASDISFDNFGLPLEQYNSLVDKIELIYHCGAQVNTMASYNKLRGSNVLGTLEIIKFATNSVDKPIHYISSLSAASEKDSFGNLSEEFPGENYDDLFGGYAISKWVSERLLTEIKNRGASVSIYRSGYISGQSDNGMTNLNDALFMLIKGCIQLGVAPDMEEKITILPVDFVSKAIVKISLDQPDTSSVYHIDHPTGILWTDLIAWLNDYGYKIKIIPMKKWQEILVDISHENALFPFLPYYLALPEKQKSPDVNSQHATLTLKKINLTYPKIDEKLLTIYFDYLCQVNFLPLPESSVDKKYLTTKIKFD